MMKKKGSGCLLVERPDRTLEFRFHAGQQRAWDAEARFLVVLAGTQSGKTVFGPCWLLREMQRRGPGDYLVVSSTMALLFKKALTAFEELFTRQLKLGTLIQTPPMRYVLSEEGAKRMFGPGKHEETRVFFGYGHDFEQLESMTAKAAWLDEVGQAKWKPESWDAVQRRLSIARGRALFTTTPYNLGWFKQQVCDRAKQDPMYELIQFPSTVNPAFPKKEFERAQATLPAWKFKMFYLGSFTQPAGLVYDCFNPDTQVIPRFEIPAHYGRFVGIDFGGVHLAAVFLARDPQTGMMYVYRTYQAGRLSVEEHVRNIQAGEPTQMSVFGGAPSEDFWRREFKKAGLWVLAPPFAAVEQGIQKVYEFFRKRGVYVFGDLRDYLEEKLTYSYLLDDQSRPTGEIEDAHAFHLMDAERYAFSTLIGPHYVVSLPRFNGHD